VAEANEINSSLMMQDEQDRSSMALFGRSDEAAETDKGTAQKSKKSELPVTIDKKCVTCSDQPGKIIQLFKVACLTYFPAPVQFHGRKQTRLQLLKQLHRLSG